MPSGPEAALAAKMAGLGSSSNQEQMTPGRIYVMDPTVFVVSAKDGAKLREDVELESPVTDTFELGDELLATAQTVDSKGNVRLLVEVGDQIGFATWRGANGRIMLRMKDAGDPETLKQDADRHYRLGDYALAVERYCFSQ